MCMRARGFPHSDWSDYNLTSVTHRHNNLAKYVCQSRECLTLGMTSLSTWIFIWVTWSLASVQKASKVSGYLLAYCGQEPCSIPSGQHKVFADFGNSYSYRFGFPENSNGGTRISSGKVLDHISWNSCTLSEDGHKACISACVRWLYLTVIYWVDRQTTMVASKKSWLPVHILQRLWIFIVKCEL